MQVAQRIVGDAGQVDDRVDAVEIGRHDVADVGAQGVDGRPLGPDAAVVEQHQASPTGS
jgi:hypothetical protein